MRLAVPLMHWLHQPMLCTQPTSTNTPSQIFGDLPTDSTPTVPPNKQTNECSDFDLLHAS
jgi:hypothetical protein